ncbi:hypothetical protein GBAR_LOCUS4767 [Geodia barretti]|uniref:Uncharacterized protein n=1 Tax=Geodia barretti TaxID=519541 RepID=A0AA35R960_GEOBA|nr:hypothetical protein GBAR_LOCUS4767 [Geodia barretti]
MTKATSYLCLVLVALALVSPSLCYPRQNGIRRPTGPENSMPEASMQTPDVQNYLEQQYKQDDQKEEVTEQGATIELPAGLIFDTNSIYILLGNNGRFVSRIRRGTIDYMEAEKVSIDYFCLLRASILYNGKLSLKSDNGNNNYLGRYTRGGVNDIEAVKVSIDVYSQFTVEVDISDGIGKGANYIYLKADNDKYVGIKDRSGRNNLEASYDTRVPATRFTLLEVF